MYINLKNKINDHYVPSMEDKLSCQKYSRSNGETPSKGSM